MAWYDTGTVSVTNGSTTVTGSGTNFVAGAQVGEGFNGPDGRLYEIQSITSATVLVLADAYLGSTQSGQDYKIVPTQSLTANLASQVSTLITDYQDVADGVITKVKASDGTAGSPSISFNSDQDTGFFHDTANEIAVSVAGTKRAEFNSTGMDVTGTITTDGIDVTGTATMDGLTVDAANTDLKTTGFTHTLNFNTTTGTQNTNAQITSSRTDISTSKSNLKLKTNDGTSTLTRLDIDDNGDISFYEDTGTTAKFFWDASAESLGIGTTTIAPVKLHISGGDSGTESVNSGYNEVYIQNSANTGITFSTPNTAQAGLAWADPESNAAAFEYYSHLTGYKSHVYESGVKWSIGGSERMRIDSSGNVGIGTSSPSATTDIDTLSAGGSTAALRLRNGSNTIGTEVRAYFTPNTSTDLNRSAYVGAVSTTVGNDSQLVFGTNASGAAPVERMRIDSSGNVGIGTSSPSSALDVIGNIESSGSATIGGGVYTSNGSAGFPVHTFSGDNDTGMFQAGANQLGFTTGGSERMCIDSSGNVGIGTSSPNYTLDVQDYDCRIALTATGGTAGDYGELRYLNSRFIISADDSNVADNSSIEFQIDDTERMRIDSSGNLLVGKTETTVNNDPGVGISQTGYMSIERASGATVMQFGVAGAVVGSIGTTASSTSYNTSSDYRLKEDWIPVANASDRVAQLKPVNFAWKADGTRVDGFLAHELAEVIPEAVTGEKDAMRTEEYVVTEAIPATYDEEGNELTPAVDAVMGTREVPDYQGIDQSKLVPLLTAALQEALTEIDNLKQRVSALENN